jgi:acyl-CoA thioesterase FadM
VTWFGSGRTASGLAPAPSAAPEENDESNVAAAPAPASGGTGLHAEQHYEYHRPLRAGERLTVSSHAGKTWEKQGRRGGLLQFAESVTEYRSESGELVVTARAVGVRTGHAVKE